MQSKQYLKPEEVKIVVPAVFATISYSGYGTLVRYIITELALKNQRPPHLGAAFDFQQRNSFYFTSPSERMGEVLCPRRVSFFRDLAEVREL